MISLGRDSILLRGKDGELQPYELEALREEVQESLALVGRGEHGIADDLMRVVRHYAATAVRNGRVMDRQEVRKLVLRILRDAGCAEAAAVMAPNDLGAIEGCLIANDESELAAVLAADPRFVGLDRSDLAAKVAAMLTAAGLPGITAAGVIELATSHILATRDGAASATQPKNASAASYWLLEGDNWGGLLSAELSQAVTAGQLRFYPVSRLAPLVQVIVDLRRLPGAATELELLPVVDELVVKLLAVLREVPAQLAAASPDVEAEMVRGRLRLVGADVVGTDRLQLGGAQLYYFLEELKARVEGRLRELGWLRIDCADGLMESFSNRLDTPTNGSRDA